LKSVSEATFIIMSQYDRLTAPNWISQAYYRLQSSTVQQLSPKKRYCQLVYYNRAEYNTKTTASSRHCTLKDCTVQYA
jgi:hypothetical protein